MPEVTVSLDTSAPAGTPAVTVTPNPLPLNKNGNQVITWKKGGRQDFSFLGVAFMNGWSTFSTIDIQPDRIRMTDDSNISGSYLYVVMVISGGVTYCSEAYAGGVRGNGSTPTIKNN
jgi:hypothetical protein